MKVWTCEWPTKDGTIIAHGMTPAIALAVAASRVGDHSAGKPRVGLLRVAMEAADMVRMRAEGITQEPQESAKKQGKSTTEGLGL